MMAAAQPIDWMNYLPTFLGILAGIITPLILTYAQHRLDSSKEAANVMKMGAEASKTDADTAQTLVTTAQSMIEPLQAQILFLKSELANSEKNQLQKGTSDLLERQLLQDQISRISRDFTSYMQTASSEKNKLQAEIIRLSDEIQKLKRENLDLRTQLQTLTG
jgi:predicted  nucleic acid-binding Zn-ribbon protein